MIALNRKFMDIFAICLKVDYYYKNILVLHYLCPS